MGSHRLFQSSLRLAALSAAFAAVPALATIDAGNHPELSLTIWDPIGQASYTKDLGIDATQFFNYAQADAGYQQFWHLNGTDSAFQQLLNLGTAATSLLWAVTAVDADGVGDPSDTSMYTTLRQGSANGVLNPDYARMTGLTANDVLNGLQVYALYITSVNNAPTAAYNTQGTDFAVNGSSFSRKGQSGYFDSTYSWEIAQGLFNSQAGHGIINNVGKSSWFYKLDSPSYDISAPVTVDEFDNLGHDGYWGLAVDPSSGDYVLSYTLVGATLASGVTTNAGILRLAATDYRAAIGTPRYVTAAAASLEFSDYLPVAIAAVPEPSSWLLSLAGLAALGAFVRKRPR